MYLAWFDPSKLPAADKIMAGLAAYLARFDRPARTVLVNVVDLPLGRISGVDVRAVPWVRPDTFYIGEETPVTVEEAV